MKFPFITTTLKRVLQKKRGVRVGRPSGSEARFSFSTFHVHDLLRHVRALHVCDMKLQQYINSFSEPLRTEDPKALVRLLDVRNKTARGLSDTVGAIDVSVSCTRSS